MPINSNDRALSEIVAADPIMPGGKKLQILGLLEDGVPEQDVVRQFSNEIGIVLSRSRSNVGNYGTVAEQTAFKFGDVEGVQLVAAE